MHSESRENMVKCYVIYENCYHHHHNIIVKSQIGMHMAANVWSHFKYMRIIHNTNSTYLVQWLKQCMFKREGASACVVSVLHKCTA